MKVLLFLAVFFLNLNYCSAQISKDDVESNRVAFQKTLDWQKITYSVPDGYEQIYLPYNAIIGSMLLSGSRHQLRAFKDSIFVYMTIEPIDTTSAYLNRMKKFGFNPNTNVEYLKTQSDTLKFPIMRNSSKVTRKKYNADVSGYYDLRLMVSFYNQYSDLYEKCRVAFIHKKNRADIRLYFFYNQVSADSVDKHMKKVLNKIKFAG